MAEGGQIDPEQMALAAEKLREQLEHATGRLDALNSMRQEKNRAMHTLQGVKEGSEGDEILLPVGGTAFVNAKLAKNEQVIMGVGADYAMPRTLDEAVQALEREVEDLNGQIESLSSQAGRLEMEYTGIVQRLQAMQGGQQR